MPNLEGKTLNNIYFLRKLIGQGGMAEVYDAFSKDRLTRMAVKVLRSELANNPRFIQSFEMEANHLRTLDHPNIVRFYELSRDQNIVFLVMDFIEGTNMRARIPKGRGLDINEVSRMLDAIVPALSYAHLKNVYHCDIKPANVLIHKDGRIFLTDFGVARTNSANMGGGTPAYMAPEMFDSGDVNKQTDVYMLGVTLYECFSGGHLPFRGDNPYSQGNTSKQRFAWEHRHLPVPPLRTINPGISPAIEQVILKAMSKNPTERFHTMMALKQAFDHAKLNGNQNSQTAERTIFVNSNHQNQIQIKKQFDGSDSIPSTPKSVIGRPSEVQAPVVPPSEPRVIDNGPHTRLETKLSSIKEILDSNLKQNLPNEPEPQFNGPYLLCHRGEWQGQMIPISRKGMTIGRSPNCQLYLREPSASRNHAVISRSLLGGVTIVDGNSAAGTFVNRQKLEAGKSIRLHHGDLIQIAQYQLFEFREK